ncbi:MAG: hypothetical protein H7249_09600 [Chitinophagaceae bacterium]|nr:hypothetical protein [Oligoflexus sp.]
MSVHIALLSTLLLVLTTGCNKASFDGTLNSKTAKTKPKTLTIVPAPTVVVPAPVVPAQSSDVQGTPGTIQAKKLNIIVTAPSNMIKAGGEKIQATAKFKDSSDVPVVIWTIKGPAGVTDIGSIDQNGMVTSPASCTSEIPVTIVATLKSDPTIAASTIIHVLPIEQIFASCTRGSETFPILAQVYQIPPTLKRIPNYSNLAEATKLTTVCMDKYAVEPRNFGDGFPDVPSVYEYFSLQTSTTLIVNTAGTYTFQLNSDDGSCLNIDGREVLNNDGEHQAYGTDPNDSLTVGRKEVTITLGKGDHPLNLNYFQGPKYRIALVLKWKKPGSSTFEYVPREAFK